MSLGLSLHSRAYKTEGASNDSWRRPTREEKTAGSLSEPDGWIYGLRASGVCLGGQAEGWEAAAEGVVGAVGVLAVDAEAAAVAAVRLRLPRSLSVM